MINKVKLSVTKKSLKTNVMFNGSNASVNGNCILLQDQLFLHKSVGLLFYEVNLIYIALLKLVEIFFKV